MLIVRALRSPILVASSHERKVQFGVHRLSLTGARLVLVAALWHSSRATRINAPSAALKPKRRQESISVVCFIKAIQRCQGVLAAFSEYAPSVDAIINRGMCNGVQLKINSLIRKTPDSIISDKRRFITCAIRQRVATISRSMKQRK